MWREQQLGLDGSILRTRTGAVSQLQIIVNHRLAKVRLESEAGEVEEGKGQEWLTAGNLMPLGA
jgi:hypothetical protein